MTVRAVVRFFALTIAGSVLMFAAAGSLAWWEGWLIAITNTLLSLGSRVLLVRTNPELAAERAASSETEREGAASWDRLLVPVVALVGPTLSAVVAGLDYRWGWSGPVPRYLWWLCLVLYCAGYGWGIWAMLVNRFFSAYARIQSDRGHEVVRTGPYAVMRHPGYAGSVLTGPASVLVLNSWWALVPASLTVAAVVVRTYLEDCFLRNELPGYEDYARRVRYRLFPGVW